ncbi:hypothetical protein ACMFMF_007635 [Clarireedia jacksonii]
MTHSSINEDLRVAPMSIQVKEQPESNKLLDVVVSRETNWSNQDRSSEQPFKMPAVAVPGIPITGNPNSSVNTAGHESQGTVRRLLTRSFDTNESGIDTPADTLKNTHVSFESKTARPCIETSTSYTTSLSHSDVSHLQSEGATSPHPQPINVTTREAAKEQRRREKADRKAASLRKRAVRRLRGKFVGEETPPQLPLSAEETVSLNSNANRNSSEAEKRCSRRRLASKSDPEQRKSVDGAAEGSGSGSVSGESSATMVKRDIVGGRRVSAPVNGSGNGSGVSLPPPTPPTYAMELARGRRRGWRIKGRDKGVSVSGGRGGSVGGGENEGGEMDGREGVDVGKQKSWVRGKEGEGKREGEKERGSVRFAEGV